MTWDDEQLAGVFGLLRGADTRMRKVIDSISPNELLTKRTTARAKLLRACGLIGEAMGLLTNCDWRRLWHLATEMEDPEDAPGG